MKLDAYRWLGLALVGIGVFGYFVASSMLPWLVVNWHINLKMLPVYDAVISATFPVLFLLGAFIILWGLKIKYTPGRAYTWCLYLMLATIILIPVGVIISYISAPVVNPSMIIYLGFQIPSFLLASGVFLIFMSITFL